MPGPAVPANVTPDEHGEGTGSRPKVTKVGHSNTKDTVKGALCLALELTESLSEGVPFLPGAVKALKTVVEVYEVRRSRSRASLRPSVELRYLIDSALHIRIMRVLQKYASNLDSMDTLRKHIESMNAMVESILPKDGACPPMLKEQLRIFGEYVHMFIHKFANMHPYHHAELTNSFIGASKASQLRWRTCKEARRIRQ